MHSINSLISNLKSNYPQFSFQESDNFLWSPNNNTIYFNGQSSDIFSLLHELSHALLNHSVYEYDIQLVKMESQAWAKAVTIAKSFDIKIPDDIIQSSLDSYREWMHARSICPSCDTTGIQTDKKNYKCLRCSNNWKVNEAKDCSLRRYKK